MQPTDRKAGRMQSEERTNPLQEYPLPVLQPDYPFSITFHPECSVAFR